MTKFFAVTIPAMIVTLCVGWAHAAPAKRCVIITEGDGTQVLVCGK